MYLESIGENWEIFLNDHSLVQEIHLDVSREMILRRTIRGFRLPVDSSLLRYGENILTFRLIGDAPASFLSKNVDLGFYIDGDYSLTTEQKLSGEISTLINLCLNTIYVFFGLYHLLIYVKRREDLYNLYFGIFSVFMALYSLSRSNIAFEVIYDTSWITRIEYSSVSLLAPLFLLFMQDYFLWKSKVFESTVCNSNIKLSDCYGYVSRTVSLYHDKSEALADFHTSHSCLSSLFHE
ncbi:7TM diverse intracellular signaling domain protein [Leptospira interrogans serovar Bataviae str. HAI135]|nr:7TM diverse intracellular signaling domain protein [Leptospira interrogans serovar Bataviae str. HAI135]